MKNVFFPVIFIIALFLPWLIRADEPGINILIITLDTTRADRIGAYGYKKYGYKKDITPNIDSLARRGVLFEKAISPVPLTLPAHCSIFTGTLPIYHNVRNNGRYRLPDSIDTLAEILRERGYTTAAFVSSFTVDSRFGLDQGFETYNDNLDIKRGQVKTYHSERSAADVFADFSAWSEDHLKENKRNFFVWVHFFDPHMPYAPPEPYKSRFRDNPYDGEIAYMDYYVGKTIELLKKKNCLSDTLVVIAGDHGEAFGEHGEMGHMMFCYRENIDVPLIFYYPSELPQNKKIQHRAGLTDILPTILDLLDIPLPTYLDGVSLLPVIQGKTPGKRLFYFESYFAKEALGCAPVQGIIRNNYKYILLPRPELFNLLSDPLEKENLFFRENPRAHRMRRRLVDFITRRRGESLKSGRDLSSEEQRKLKSLGYFTSSNHPRSPDGTQIPDPKDKIEGFTAFVIGNQFLGRKQTTRAINQFKKAIDMIPSFSWPYSTLAMVYYRDGQPAQARQILEQGIRNAPREYQLQIEYAQLLINMKKPDRAVQILRDLRKQPGIIDAAVEIDVLLGEIYTGKKDIPNAILSYRRALGTEPDNRTVKRKLVFLLHQSNRLNEALAIYRQLEKETPTDVGLLFNMAVLFEQLKKYPSALVYYRKLLTPPLDEKTPERAYYNYALLMARTGYLKEAVQYMRRFLNRHTRRDPLRQSAERFIDKWSKQK